jgi:protein TonB
MRYFYMVICGLSGWLARPAQAQEVAGEGSPATDSVRYEKALETRSVNSQTDSAGTCTEVLRWGESAGLVRVFYPSGHLKEYVPYADLATGRQHGLATTWFDSGQLQTKQIFWLGQRTDTLCVYYETGALKRKTSYVAGNEQIGQCYDPSGQPVAYFPYEQLPLYPGGAAQLTKEITKAIRLPHPVPVSAFLGPLRVDVMLQIAEDGSIRMPRVAHSSGLVAFDQAVLTAIAKLTRRFSPGRRDERFVSCAYYIPVQLTVASGYRGR